MRKETLFPIPKKIIAFLDTAGVAYEIVKHRVVYTAYDLAQTLGIPPSDIAKALLLKGDRGFFIALLSAAHTIDFARVKHLAKVKSVRLPKEKEILKVLKMKRGSIPAFSHYHRLPVLLDATLHAVGRAIFTAGSFTQSIRMRMKDFTALEKPTVGRFAVRKKIKKPRKKKPSVRNQRKKTPSSQQARRKKRF